MSSPPVWLADDVVQDVAVKVAKNPAAQNAAKKAAQDPAVQKALINEAKRQSGVTQDENTPDWASDNKPVAANDVEANMFGSGSNNTGGSDADARSKKLERITWADILRHCKDEELSSWPKSFLCACINFSHHSSYFGPTGHPCLWRCFALSLCYRLFFTNVWIRIAVGSYWLIPGCELWLSHSIIGRWIFLLFGFMINRISLFGKNLHGYSLLCGPYARSTHLQISLLS